MEVSSYGFGVDQGSIQFILDALLATVQPCFGPRAGSVAVKTNTGTSLITCNGAAILRFLLDTSIEHPVAKFIVKSVLEHAERYGTVRSLDGGIVENTCLENVCHHTGDGSKRLLLMLSAGWRERKRRLTPDEARQLVHVARTLTNNTVCICSQKCPWFYNLHFVFFFFKERRALYLCPKKGMGTCVSQYWGNFFGVYSMSNFLQPSVKHCKP